MVGFDVFYSESEEPHYTDKRVGTGVTVGRALTPDLSLTVRPSVEVVDIHDVSDDAPADVIAARGHICATPHRARNLRFGRQPFLPTQDYVLDGDFR